MTESEPAIQIRQLRVIRGGVPILPCLTVDLPAGKVTGLLGPSGCGKTTLMRSIVGVQRIADGSVTVLGEAAGSRSLRTRVSYVTQAPAVYADLTVRENLRYFAGLVGVGGDAVRKVLETVGLDALGERLVSRLSGGQRSRVGLATALLNNPAVLILDEPTVGLDPVSRRDLWRVFHGLAAEGCSLLISSHVMDEAKRCDHLLLMRNGSVIASEAPETLLARAGSTDVETAFLSLVEDGRPE